MMNGGALNYKRVNRWWQEASTDLSELPARDGDVVAYGLVMSAGRGTDPVTDLRQLAFSLVLFRLGGSPYRQDHPCDYHYSER